MSIFEKSICRQSEVREREWKRFLDLTDRLLRSRDPEEQSRLKKDLVRMTFDE